MKDSTRKVWALESGFNTDNEKRDRWFAETLSSSLSTTRKISI